MCWNVTDSDNDLLVSVRLCRVSLYLSNWQALTLEKWEVSSVKNRDLVKQRRRRKNIKYFLIWISKNLPNTSRGSKNKWKIWLLTQELLNHFSFGSWKTQSKKKIFFSVKIQWYWSLKNNSCTKMRSYFFYLSKNEIFWYSTETTDQSKKYYFDCSTPDTFFQRYSVYLVEKWVNVDDTGLKM